MRVLILLSLCSWLAVGAADPVLRDDDAAGIIDRALVIPKEQFNRKLVEKMCKEFIEKHKGRFVLLRLMVATDQSELLRSLRQGSTAAITPESVLEDLKGHGLPKGPIARVLARRDGALLSYLSPNGEFSEWLIAGQQDPTRIRILNTDCRLLHFRLEGAGSAHAQSRSPDSRTYPYALAVYFQCAPSVSASVAAALARSYANETRIETLAVNLRSDTWFLGDKGYPEVYRFQGEIVVPHTIQIRLRPSVACGITRGDLKCTGTNFEP